jgi:hypothetical protein
VQQKGSFETIQLEVTFLVLIECTIQKNLLELDVNALKASLNLPARNVNIKHLQH